MIGYRNLKRYRTYHEKLPEVCNLHIPFLYVPTKSVSIFSYIPNMRQEGSLPQ